jgi:hypothetical protein
MTDQKKTSTGDCSTGDCSTGNRSTGDCSTGHFSTGDCSTGDFSTGDYSTGYFSTGHCSTGDYSTGRFSTGHFSTGDYSTGRFSTGHCSTGDYSTGRFSTGHCSISNRSTGHFSTIDGQPSFFDKPFSGTWDEATALIPQVKLKLGAYWVDSSEMTAQQKADHPSHETIRGVLLKYDHTYHQAWAIAWTEMNQATKDRFLNLPNFDADKFKMITGIDTAVVNEPRRIMVINGKTYRLDKITSDRGVTVINGELYQLTEEV